MFVEGKSRTVFFPSDTLIYGICRDGSKNYNIRACEHMILGQLRMGARHTIYAPLGAATLVFGSCFDLFYKFCNKIGLGSPPQCEGRWQCKSCQ